ncbi:MAG: hypothetical protein ABI615_02575 [Chthoniobacterales bacterium]
MQPTVPKRHPNGYYAAVAGSVLIVGAAVMLVLTTAYFFVLIARAPDHSLAAVNTSSLPILTYLCWMGTIAGSAASILAIAVYRFRSRWFWRCLVTASVVWLAAPPIGTVIGLITLIVLISFRSSFEYTHTEPPTS